MAENINVILEKILEKVEPEKRNIAFPIILNMLRKKLQSDKNIEKNIYEEGEAKVDLQGTIDKDTTELLEQDISNEELQESDEIKNGHSNIISEDQGVIQEDIIEEDIKYSLSYNNIVENKEERIPSPVAEINAIVEKSDSLDNEKIIKASETKKNSATIKPTVLSCKVNAYNVTSLQNCISEDIEDPMTMEAAKEPAMINAPVVLSQVNMEVFIEAITRFPEPIFSIDDLDKSMTLTSCKLIPKSNRLFLEGFIEKKIEYSNVVDITKKEINGDIKNLTVKIPFKCATEVTFARKPHNTNYSLTQRIEIFNSQHKFEVGNKTEEKSSIETQELENQVYCKLEDIAISEKSKKLGIIKLDNTLPNAFTFKKIKEKTVVSFTLSLLQNQDVFIANKDHIVKKNCEDGNMASETQGHDNK
ncbi:hypothetical protein [Clostridium sp.]|uniref:CsxC family protein n=1 Tax=Clostridium sp. TaxID=1506 RepID=UPI002FCAD7AB